MDAPDDFETIATHVKRAQGVMSARHDDYVKGREYYDGTRAEVAASAAVRTIIQRSAEAVPLNFAHIPVDAVVDKVDFGGVTSKEERARAALEELADNNDLDVEIDDWTLKAGFYGDYYVIVDPTLEEEASGAVMLDGIRYIGCSPLTGVRVYEREDERTPAFGWRRWQRPDKSWRGRVFYDDCTVKVIGPMSEDEPGAEDWTLDYPDDGEPGDAFLFHDGGRMLIQHLAVGTRPYGTPLHIRGYGAQDAITKVNATNLVNVDALSFPDRWALLDPAAEIDDSIDDDFGTDGPDTVVAKKDGQTTTTNGTRLRTLPGTIQMLAGVKSVGTFEHSDSDPFLKSLEWYLRAMAVATGTPLFEFDVSTGEQPSGEARRRAEGRVNRRADKLIRSASAFIEDVSATALGLLGIDDATLTANYAPVETSTDEDGLKLVALKIKNGVPVQTALIEAGYTVEQVTEWWPSNAPAVTYEVLALVAQALQQLGQAETLGVIQPAETAAMLPTILTAARGEGPAVEVLPGVVQPARPALTAV